VGTLPPTAGHNSGICYGFYNADLTDPSNLYKDMIASAFVNDSFLAACTKTIETLHDMMRDMMQCENSAIEWSHKHNSYFKMAKNVLMIFTNQRIPDPVHLHETIPIL
jgi:hypothetical protein